MTKSNIEKISGRIWLTERAHMKAEKRNRFLEHYFHIALAMFSLSSIAISVLQDAPDAGQVDRTLTITSVIALSISLLIFGFKFGETAAKHRSCYLDLQRLRYSGEESDVDFNKEYIDILGYYPNHLSSDYYSVVISSIFSQNQELSDPNGDLIKLSVAERFWYVFFWVVTRLFLFAFALCPLVLAAFSLSYDATNGGAGCL